MKVVTRIFIFMMYSILRPLLFRLDAEAAHALTLSTLHYLPKWCFKKPKAIPIKAMGIEFTHPVGLAAGLDKNGQHLDALAKLGFSFIELGTVTPKPQMGNKKPRLFRCVHSKALINRMGFNNLGVDALVQNVKKAAYQGVLGINIGKNKDTPLDKASEDYLHCMQKVYESASYIVINISSPNTPDLRHLQKKEYLDDLLSQLKMAQNQLANQCGRYVPLVVKVSPDESDEALKEMSGLIVQHGLDGIIATNTTASRNRMEDSFKEEGGISGRPLRELSNRCIRLLKTYVGDALTLIGTGGVDDLESATEKLRSGADLLQLYTGLIYQGPGLVYQLTAGLRDTGC